MQVTPVNVEQAIEDLTSYYGPELNEAAERMSETDFLSWGHMAAGAFIRDSWMLWWRPGHNNSAWPQEKPAIVDFFNKLGIVEADDMSNIILTSVYRTLKGIPVDLSSQVSACRQYWQQKGYPDGIPG